MTSTLSFSDYAARLRDFISCSSRGNESDSFGTNHGILASAAAEFSELALVLFRLQFENVPAYRRFCESRTFTPEKIKAWNEIPAIPTSAFKELELTSLSESERITVFHSSGTTEQRPSRHFHNAQSLSIYESSLLPWFQNTFLGDWDDLQRDEVVDPLDKPAFIFLTPPTDAAPHSSLVHMFETVRRELGSRDSFFGGRVDQAGAWTLDMDQVLFGIRKSMCANRPLCLCGTAFSFVHLLDHFAANNMRYRVAAGSRVLETGGYKGRSRELPKKELHALITKHLGVPASHIVCEYGMSELSSQAYDSIPGGTSSASHSPVQPDQSGIRGTRPSEGRIFHFPPWARVQIISPETGREVAEGETGLIRIFDLANVRSVMAIQTEDLGVRRGEGFELLGRASQAEPRGCSLMAS